MKTILGYMILMCMILISCKKASNSSCPSFTGYQVPYSLFFLLKQNGQRLPDLELNNLKLSYYLNGQKNYTSDFQRAINEGNLNAYDLGISVTRDIGLTSARENVKDYYIEFPDGDIDTLYVDYRQYSQCEADTSACQCLYPRFTVKYNGNIVSYDPTITQQSVYLFNKN